MNETAETHIVALTTNRVCVIEIKNDSSTYCLYKPQVHMESGFSFSPPSPTLMPHKSEVLSFTKDDNTASGAVGVMTYELFKMREQKSTEVVAVMFSVPFDYTFYKNWLGIGIFDKAVQCDEALFKEMYNSKDKSNFVRYEANGSGIVHRGKDVDIRATMCDGGRAIVKMELYDSFGQA